MGWFHGGAVNGDRRGIKGYPALHSEVLTTAVQRQLLDGIDWKSSFATPGLSVIVHDGPPADQDDQARTTTLIADHPNCYGELLVHSVLVERAALSSSTVRVMVIVKRWSAGQSAPNSFSIMETQTVDLGNRDAAVVEASVKDGFVSSIQKVLASKYLQRH